MASGPNINSNLIEAGRLIADAAESGAQLVVLPENFAFLGQNEKDKLAVAEDAGNGRMQSFLSEQAAQHKIWLVGGTIPIKSGSGNKVRAACLVFNDAGEQVARYDKIHLFDVQLTSNGEQYNESEAIEAGDQAVVIDSPFGRLGIAICYDLRFPELFRNMIGAGAEVIAMPSAFTAITGKAHWHVLVRARAIENLCYVIAADQGGYHVSGRETYGHSMIVDPWGQVLDELASGSGVVRASSDRVYLAKVRNSFPVLEHRRMPCRMSS
ncbi:MAG: carbon-nitrogen hydrolase family protein [Granulosicoccaceae bacterium]|jgi:nitrilase